MSARHPIIAVTGSSGAGTSTVKTTFEWIFRREKIDAAIVEGDAFHRYDRVAMRQQEPVGAFETIEQRRLVVAGILQRAIEEDAVRRGRGDVAPP